MLKSEFYRFNFALLKTSKIKGDDQMGKLEVGQKYKVNGPEGELHLRKEAAIKNNIIDTMPNGSEVTLISEETKIGNKFKWYNIKYKNKTGWAVGKHLVKVPDVSEIDNPPVEDVSSAPPSITFSFLFDGKTKYITEKNLKTALDFHNKYISKNEIKIKDGGIKITLNGKYQNQSVYWATRKNLKTMDDGNLIT